MTHDKAVSIIENMRRHVWDAMDFSKIDDYYAQDFICYIGDQKTTLADMKARADEHLALYQSIDTELDDIISEGNKIALRAHRTLIYKNGEKLRFGAILIYEINSEGKAAVMWYLSDNPHEFSHK